ncbi:hypothetical protein [Alienimonas sp. DA493]|uniref:hypothetical protein n=1 Tax=Alienimonas sp. DA493 TaxID=3373605 RepID=UPI003754DA2F
MLKAVVRQLDFTSYQEVALALFVGCFVLIAFGAARLSRGATDRFSGIPLEDDVVNDPR